MYLSYHKNQLVKALLPPSSRYIHSISSAGTTFITMVLIMSRGHNKQSVEMNIVSCTFDYEKCSQLVFITKYKKLFTRFSGIDTGLAVQAIFMLKIISVLKGHKRLYQF